MVIRLLCLQNAQKISSCLVIKNLMSLAYYSLFLRTFRMTIQWLVAVANKIDQQAQLLHRRCSQYGLKLVSVPHYSCLTSCFRNPVSYTRDTAINCQKDPTFWKCNASVFCQKSKKSSLLIRKFLTRILISSVSLLVCYTNNHTNTKQILRRFI